MGDCEDLIGQLSSYLSRWRNKSVSYAYRLELSNWVLMGKLQYWLQSLCLPIGVLKLAHEIICQFVWGEMKGMAWTRMRLRRTEGVLGIQDLIPLARVHTMRRAL